jgi:hypothetical protein
MPMDAMAVNRRASDVFLPLLRDLTQKTLCRMAGPARTVSGTATESSLQHMRTGDQRWPRQSGGSGKCRTVSSYFVSWPLWRLSPSADQRARPASACQRSPHTSDSLRGAA